MGWIPARAGAAGASLAALACLLAAGAAAPGRAQVPTCFDQTATIVGTDGADELLGTAGDDVIVSLGGDDTVNGLAGNDRICSGEGADSVLGSDGDDLLAGEAGSDGFLGLLGNDLIDGGPDLDGIDGGFGDDRLIGGEGVDLLTFLSDAAPVRVDLRAGTATGHGTDVLEGFEAIAGSLSGDELNGSDASEFFFPRGGDDVVRGEGGFDIVVFLAPVTASLVTGRATGEGNDRLTGIEGLAGGQTGARGSVFTGDRSGNYLQGSVAADVMSGGAGDDVFTGTGGADRLRGDAGADLMAGGAGNDMFDGGAGQDIASYLGSSAPVRVDLTRGSATGEGRDRLARIERVAGSQLGDVIAGDAAANSLEGKGGDDRLLGRAAADFLDGGSGTDVVDGGGGRNYCLDGERRTRCQVSEQSSTPAAQVAPRAPAATGRARPAADPLSFLLEGLRRAAGGADLSVASGGGGRTFGDGVQYVGVPVCTTAGGRGKTEIEPPKYIAPLAVSGTQEVHWRGILRRGGTIVHRTPIVEAVIAGSIQNDGYPQEWKDSRNRVLRNRVVVPITTRGVYRWYGEIMHVQTSDRVARLVARVPPPPDCTFR